MTIEFNKDIGKISNYNKNDEGYLTLGIVTGVPDKVLEYGDRKEIITKDALTSPETLGTITGKPIVINHPNVAINSTNRRKYEVGVFFNDSKINKDGLAVTSAMITDEDTIKRIEKGELTHVSMGYYADKQLNTDGVYVQLNRNYNHGALLTPGNVPRAGEMSKLFLQNDSLNLEEVSKENNTDSSESADSKDAEVISNKVNLSGLQEDSSGVTNIPNPPPPAHPSTSPNKRPKATPPTPPQESTTKENKPVQQDAKSISRKVELISEWKPVLDEEGVSINYDGTENEIKKQILGCYYESEVMNQINTDSVDGFWLSFVTEHYSRREQARQERRQINTDSTDGINLDFDTYQQKLRQEYVKMMS